MKHQITHEQFDWLNSGVSVLFKEYEYALEDYINRLLWWNRKVNLVSRNVSRETLKKHVEHSLTLAGLKEVRESQLIVDAGTGGGLPGIPLAIALPSKELVLNDIVEKKMMAVKQIVLQMGLSKRVRCKASSIELLEEKNYILVSKHAFKVNEIYSMVNHQKWSSMILLKGRDEVEHELEGIAESLDIKVLDLYAQNKDEFYQGKGLVIIKRGKDEER